jgi:hypothetical protein
LRLLAEQFLQQTGPPTTAVEEWQHVEVHATVAPDRNVSMGLRQLRYEISVVR